MNIKLKIKGPFNLVGDNSLFNIAEGNLSGLYIFTIKVKDRYLIEYVGITTRDFKTRFLEHIPQLLSGGYQLYDMGKLRDDKEFLVWKGKYGENTDDITVFLNNYQYFSQIIKQQLQEFKIFLIPLTAEKRILERIESKIYEVLRENNNKQIMTFIKGVRSNPRRKDEKLINVQMEYNILSPEIPSNFEV